MITAFYQGKAGNCASISVIKAAMLKYGFDCVVKCKEISDYYEVTLKDTCVVVLTKSELDTLKTRDKFIAGTDSVIYNKAKFLYAVIAKVKTEYAAGKGKYQSVSDAANELNGGENLGSRDIFPLLGLKPSAKINMAEISEYENLIVTSKFHSAFSSKGYYDEYGGKAMVSDFKANHKKGWLFWQSSDITDAFFIQP